MWGKVRVDLALASAERREKEKKRDKMHERGRSPREILRSTRILLHRYFHATSERSLPMFFYVHIYFYYDR